MAKNGMKLMDSDMHIIEPPDLWERYIDPVFKERAPKGWPGHENPSVLEVEGTVYPKSANNPTAHTIRPCTTRSAVATRTPLPVATMRCHSSRGWTPKALTWRCYSPPAGCMPWVRTTSTPSWLGPAHVPTMIGFIGLGNADIDGYSDLNIRFHQAIIALSKSQLLATMTETLFIHTCPIRERTIGENDRAQRSIIDHMNIITALEDRDADLAERLSREHTLVLTAYVEKNVTYLD